MTTYIALLRAINLAGRNIVSMAGLRGMAEDMGFRDVRTLLQSGNLIFSAGPHVDVELERSLERQAKQVLGIETRFIVRSVGEIRRTIEVNPFPEAARDDPAHLVVVFLKDAPAASAVEALRSAIKGRETVEARGRELYVVYPDGIGRSKLTAAIIDRQLRTPGTGRNWNTVLRLAAMSGAA